MQEIAQKKFQSGVLIFFLIILMSAEMSSIAKADAPCIWAHPGVLINKGMFITAKKDLFFTGEWDSNSNCSFAWDENSERFRNAEIPIGKSVCGIDPIRWEDYDGNKVEDNQIIVDCKEKKVIKNGLAFKLINDFSKKVVSSNLSNLINLTCSGVPLKFKGKDENFTVISTKTPFSDKDWIVLFYNSSKRCLFMEVGWAKITSVASDLDFIYFGFTEYDDVESCETYNSPGIIKCNINNGQWNLLGKKDSKFFEYEVLHMAFWKHKIFVATRLGVTMSPDGVKWVDFEIKSEPHVGAKFKPLLFEMKDKIDQPWDWDIVPCEIVDVQMRIAPDVKILRSISFGDQSGGCFYCINHPVNLYWHFDPDISGQYYAVNIVENHENMKFSIWDTTALWKSCDKEIPPLKICWRYEFDPIKANITPLNSDCYMVNIPFCWVSSSIFALKLEKMVHE